MFLQNWKKEIISIPNLLSILRILMIPIYVLIYQNAQTASDYWIAGSLVAISCITDALDGYIARRYEMHTMLGKILDPLADKLTQLSLCICVHTRYPIVTPLLYLLIAKEVCQLIGLILLMKKGLALPGSISPGKISTFILFFSFIYIISFPTLPNFLLSSIVLVDLSVLLYAMSGYCFLYLENISKLRKFQI